MNVLNDNLGAVLMLGNTLLHFKDFYDRRDVLTKSIGNYYQYFAELLSICNASIGVSNIKYLAGKANLTALKISQLSVSLLETCLIIADPSPRMSRTEKIARIATNIFQALRLLFEMRSYISFSSPYKFALADPIIWCTLLAFEFSARLFLFDQRRSKIEEAHDPHLCYYAFLKYVIDRKKKSEALIWNLPKKDAEKILKKDMPNATPEEIDRRFEQLYQSVQNWSELLTIPDEINEDPVLQEFKCGITNRCIRFIVAPEIVAPKSEVGVYYEQAEVDRYLNELKPPPGWPSDIEFSRENVKPNRSLQKVIDSRLSKIAQAWKESRGKDREQAI